MNGRKTAVYRNELGQEVVMDNRTIFLEYIDMTGVSGRHIREALAGADGQTTVESFLEAKVIPCSLAFYDRTKTAGGDYITTELLGQIFSPKFSGVLTVYTKTGRKYSIDVRPQNNPTFKRDAKRVWRFDIDFTADFPYWRIGAEKKITIPGNNTKITINSQCIHEIAPVIFLPATSINGNLNLNDKLCFYIKHHEQNIKIDSLTFKITDADTGGNCNQLIDAQYDISAIRLKHGSNKIGFTYHSTGNNPEVIMKYYNLSLGEV